MTSLRQKQRSYYGTFHHHLPSCCQPLSQINKIRVNSFVSCDCNCNRRAKRESGGRRRRRMMGAEGETDQGETLEIFGEEKNRPREPLRS